jgi:hypothetical protein
VDILLKDDVTVLLLLCVSFMVIDERHGREDWRESKKGFQEEGGEVGVERAGEGKQSMEKGKRKKKTG